MTLTEIRRPTRRPQRATLVLGPLLLLLQALAGGPAQADTVAARCELWPAGSRKAAGVMGCTFSQRQGYISIRRGDGVVHDFSPAAAPGAYTDADGIAVRRQVRPDGLRFSLPGGEALQVRWDTQGLPADAPRYERRLALQGIGWQVQAVALAGAPGRQRVTVTATGLSHDRQPQVADIDGAVIGAEVADLDRDGSPELYLYTSGPGAEAPGGLLAYAANRRRSLSGIGLADLADTPEALVGYRGGDRWAIVENSLVRRFPLRPAADPAPGAPHRAWRQLQYKLVPGEAQWRLQVDRIVDY